MLWRDICVCFSCLENLVLSFCLSRGCSLLCLLNPVVNICFSIFRYNESMSSDIPNLPGFRSNKVSRRPVKQQFKYVNGYAVENDAPNDTGVKRTLLDYNKLQSEAPKRPAAGPSKLPQWLGNARIVYRFHAYFLESVAESNAENHRVRKCDVHYYTEDGAISVSEPKQENSGIPQGTFIKRHKIPYNANGESRYVGLDDIEVGDTLVLYGRTFKIVDCDAFTRKHLQEAGFAVKDPLPYPVDKYSKSRTEFMQRETGADSSVYRGVRNNPMKEFMEARLGNESKNNRTLGQFLSKDRKVLRFDSYWDDSGRYAGELRFFKLHYYLSSDEVEVIEIFPQNSGFDKMPKLLQKSKLPKPSGGVVGIDDLAIGVTIDIFGRDLVLTNADTFTRAFYNNRGTPLGQSLQKTYTKREFTRETEPPEHLVSSFGTEADSRRSWESLHPTPPRKDLAKMMKYDGKIICYKTKLCADGKKKQVAQNDVDRVFVFKYFLSDDTMSIFEPPIRNSGFIGGKFLERGKHKNVETGKFFAKDDFKVNGKIRICGRCFMVFELSDEFGGAKSKKAIGASNMQAIITKVENKLRRHGASLARTFRSIDLDKSNTVTYDEMKMFLKSYFTADELTDQEVFVVMRYFDTDGEGRIDYNEFAEKILGSDIGENNYTTTSSQDGGDTMAQKGLAMSAAELAKYQRILEEAVENEKRKAYLDRSISQFRTRAESIKSDRLKAMFKANDVNFKRQITFDRLYGLLAQQDSGGSNSGEWSLRMDKKAARVVAAELYRNQGLTPDQPMVWDKFKAAFTFAS